MNREQTLNAFWNSFDVPAYDAITMPTDDEMQKKKKKPFPRITYEVRVNEFGVPTSLLASIWDRSTGWEGVSTIASKIDSRLSEGGQTMPYDKGVIWFKKGNPFLQRMADPDDAIRRIVVNIEVEYLEV